MAAVDTNNVDIWVACSGGLDSVVLAHLLHHTSKKIGLLHANFQLRGVDSEKDQQFVEQLAAQLGVPVEVNRFELDASKNTQLQAREMRYAWFKRVAKRDDSLIALAHHLDDQIETFFLQLERGAGWSGMRGMVQLNGVFLRPLLHLEKHALLSLATEQGWQWREDVSNQKMTYRRNYWRLKIIPQLFKTSEEKQNLIALIKNTQNLHRSTHALMPSIDKQIWNWVFVKDWLAFPLIFWQYFMHDLNLPKAAIARVNKLCSASTGAYCQLEDWRIYKDRGKLWWIPKTTILNVKINASCTYHDEVPENFDDNSLYLDADKIYGDLVFKSWQKGDKFVPFGRTKPKLVSDIFLAKKVPHFFKPFVPIARDDKGIVAIGNYQIADRVRITPNTNKVIKIVWTDDLLTCANNIFEWD